MVDKNSTRRRAIPEPTRRGKPEPGPHWRFDAALLVISEGDSAAVVERAARFAFRHGARLRLLEIRRTPRRWLPRLASRTAGPVRPAREHRRNELRSQLARAVGQAAAHRVTITFSQAKLHDAVARELRGFAPDMVLTAKPRPETSSRDLNRLLRGCPVPVLTIEPGPARSIRRILAAVSGGETGEQQALDREVLRRARGLALAEGASLDVVHAWLPYGEKMLRSHSGQKVHAAEHERIVGLEHRRLLRRALDSADLSGVRICSHLVKGEADHVIAELAHSRDADVVVVGHPGRGGVSAAIVGNTAEMVVSRTACAVLSVSAELASAPSVVPRVSYGQVRAEAGGQVSGGVPC